MRSDVTAGYVITDVERLRKPMQAITDCMLSTTGLRLKAKVIAFGADTPRSFATSTVPPFAQ
jgi:hypothetical protein